MNRENIKHFIQCSCNTGGLLMNGIEFEDCDGVVLLYNVHTWGTGPSVGFWQRVKSLCALLFKSDLRYNDAVLNYVGVKQLRDACQDALDRWPDAYTEIERVETLKDIYQSMVDEDMGRKLRESNK